MDRIGTGTVFIEGDDFLTSVTSAMQLVPNIAALKALSDPGSGLYWVEGYTSLNDGGQGVFVYNPADTTSADNGGTIIQGTTLPGRWYREYDGYPSIDFFGAQSGVDSHVAIIAALAACPIVEFTPGKVYWTSVSIAGNSGNQVFGYGATLKAISPFTGNPLVTGAGGMKVYGLTLDGTGLNAPSADWLGVGVPIGCLFTAASVNGWELHDVTFQNCPSGATFIRSCNNYLMRDCVANGTQTHTGNITNAVFETFGCSDSLYDHCTINGYNWKGFNQGNGTRMKVVRGIAQGAGQNAGHAAHYEDGCTDCEYIDCTHVGVGFGYKAHSGIRPKLRGYVANGSAGGVYFQGCANFEAEGIDVLQDLSCNQAVIIEGINPGGPTAGGRLVGFNLVRAQTGTPVASINNIGVKLIAGAVGYECKDILIENGVIDGQNYDVWTAHSPNTIFSNITVDNVRTLNSINGWLLYPQSIAVRNSQPGLPSGVACPLLIFSTTGIPATLWDFDNNTFPDLGHNTANEAIRVGYDPSNNFQTRAEVVRLTRNKTFGGGSPIHVDLTNTAGGAGTNYINALVIEDNLGFDVGSATGMTLDLNATTTCQLELNRNTLSANTAGGRRNLVITNGAQVTGGTCDQNDVFQVTGRPSTVYPYFGTAAPTTGTWNVNDRVTNSAYALGTPSAWHCTVAGTPGTWVAEGPIYLSASAIYNAPSIAPGALDTAQSVTVTGAVLLGNWVEVSVNLDLQGMILNCWISAPNTVKFQLYNPTVGAIDLGSATYSVRVWQ